MVIHGVDLDVLHPEDRDMVEGFRAWRMGPWRGRVERWDLMPVSSLGLSRGLVRDLFGARIHVAGDLARALRRDPLPRPFAGRHRRRASAERAVAAAIAAAEPECQAIGRDLAELVDHLVARRAAS